MPNNTRARSNELNALAAEIAVREHVDPTNPPADNRAYISEIMTRGKCHRETARAVWARYMRRARHPLNNTWGGAGRGQGRKSAQTEALCECPDSEPSVRRVDVPSKSYCVICGKVLR